MKFMHVLIDSGCEKSGGCNQNICVELGLKRLVFSVFWYSNLPFENRPLKCAFLVNVRLFRR